MKKLIFLIFLLTGISVITQVNNKTGGFSHDSWLACAYKLSAGNI